MYQQMLKSEKGKGHIVPCVSIRASGSCGEHRDTGEYEQNEQNAGVCRSPRQGSKGLHKGFQEREPGLAFQVLHVITLTVEQRNDHAESEEAIECNTGDERPWNSRSWFASFFRHVRCTVLATPSAAIVFHERNSRLTRPMKAKTGPIKPTKKLTPLLSYPPRL